MQKRQGDIFFEVCHKPTKQMARKLDNVIAYGEVTGHKHAIVSPPLSECEVYVDENGDIYAMSTTTDLVVEHDEHNSITMPANEWICITRQREYDVLSEMRERKVAD